MYKWALSIGLVLFIIWVLIVTIYRRTDIFDHFSDAVPIDMDEQMQYKRSGNYELGHKEYMKMLNTLFAKELDCKAAATYEKSPDTVTITDSKSPESVLPPTIADVAPTTVASLLAPLPIPPFSLKIPTISESAINLPPLPPSDPTIPKEVTNAYATGLQYFNRKLDKDIQIVDDTLIKYRILGPGWIALRMDLTLYREGAYHCKQIGTWIEVRNSSPKVRDIWMIGSIFEDATTGFRPTLWSTASTAWSSSAGDF